MHINDPEFAEEIVPLVDALIEKGSESMGGEP